MSQYKLVAPDFIEDDVDEIEDTLCEYGVRTARAFSNDFLKKLDQIEQFPFSCAVDQVYPSLTEKGDRKAALNKDRFLVLYMIKEQESKTVIIMVERTERNYITTFKQI
ncbi:MAG: type II toxin-antitoxin system RelE/ParE family toxin [Oscillospiraceae bacterium]|nr:type II toxin-antitoxin system RelE/ParE family toxin [Oscillospiraceae bacterium]